MAILGVGWGEGTTPAHRGTVVGLSPFPWGRGNREVQGHLRRFRSPWKVKFPNAPRGAVSCLPTELRFNH